MPGQAFSHIFTVTRYRRELALLDPAALRRTLRDERSDRKIRRHIATKTPLATRDIERLVAFYSRQLEDHQLDVENRLFERQAAAGRFRALWEQAFRENTSDRWRAVKVWRTRLDDRVRDAHQELEGVAVPFDALFNTADTGFIWGPPQAYNCRCWIEVFILDEDLDIGADGTVTNMPRVVSGERTIGLLDD